MVIRFCVFASAAAERLSSGLQFRVGGAEGENLSPSEVLFAASKAANAASVIWNHLSFRLARQLLSRGRKPGNREEIKIVSLRRRL